MSLLANRALAGHHEFIAVRIDTHGKVKWVLGSVGWLSGECASVLFEPDDSFVKIIDTEAEPRPCAFTFTTSVDADGGSSNDHFTPWF